MIDWPPNQKLAKLLRNVCAVGWLLCLIAAPRFVGTADDKKPGIELVLFIGVFPLFFGAVRILQKRKMGAARDWTPVLFRGVPKQFSLTYKAYFYGVWLVCVYPMLRQMLDKPEWPSFGISNEIGFVLIPSVFYLTCVGAYWSAAVDSEESS